MSNPSSSWVTKGPRKLSLGFLTRTKKAQDYIAEQLSHEIELHRCKSFAHFTITATVHPVLGRDPSEAVYNQHSTFVGYDRYVFDVWGQPEKVIDVRLGPNGEIAVWHLERWARFADYVDLVQPQLEQDAALDSAIGRSGHQWNWWLANDQSFRFLDLPAEIRETIYRYAFGQIVEPYPTSKARRRGQNQVIKERNPSAKILRTNRQVYTESSHILFSYTPFFVEHRGVLKMLLRAPAQCSRIRRLELALSHHDFFRTFGFSFTDEFRYQSPRIIQALRKMTLNHLELSIAPPSLRTESTWADGACQSIVVDWILEAAWPWVRGHPVKVTGYVKSKQKVAFEALCLVEKRAVEVMRGHRIALGLTEGTLEEYDEWLECLEDDDGGVRLDGKDHHPTVAKEGMQGTGDRELPPQCRCVVPCTQASWDPDT